MAREFEFSLIAELEDKASRGLRSLRERLEDLNDYAGGRGGLLSGFADRWGLGKGPGGIGGVVSDTLKGVQRLAMAPVRGLTKLTRLIPKVGGLASAMGQTAMNAFQGILDIVNSLVGGALNAMLGLLRRISSVLGDVISKLMTWGGLAVVGGGAYAVKKAGDVRDAWNRVRRIMDFSPKESSKWMEKIHDQAIRTGKSFQELSEGFRQIVSAGIKKSKNAFRTLKVAAEASRGGLADMGAVVKMTTKAMTNFDKPATQVRDVMDSLLATAKEGQITIEELAQYFAPLSKMASEAGLSMDETLGILGVVARTDEPAKVVTQLTRAFQKMVNPTMQARKEMQKLKKRGFDIGPDFIKQEGIWAWIDRIEKLRRQAPASFAKIFPEQAAMGAMTMVDQLEQIKDSTENIKGSAGETRSQFDQMMDSVNKSALQALQVLNTLLAAFGGPIERYLTGLRDRIEESGLSMDWFRDKAETAGEKVRDQFEKGDKYLTGLFEDREFDMEGIKDALGEVKDDAVKKAQETWKKIKKTLWPKIKSAFKTLMGDLWSIVDDKVAQLPQIIGRSLMDVATRRMEQISEKAQIDWSEMAKALKHPTPGGMGFRAIMELMQELGGRVNPVAAMEMSMWQNVKRAGGAMTRIGNRAEARAIERQTAARRRRRQAARRERRERRRDVRSQTKPSVARAWEKARSTLEQVLQDAEVSPKEYVKMQNVLARLIRKKGKTTKEIAGLRSDMMSTLKELHGQQTATEKEVQELRRELKRLAVARN